MAECAKSLMNYKVFWRARALKTQIFKKLRRVFCASRYKNKQRTGYLYFRASYSRGYVQLEELKSLFSRKFLIFGIIYVGLELLVWFILLVTTVLITGNVCFILQVS